ncbi:MAG: hypothetical protein J6Z79_02025 [Clostridia bacterium]|nr:hypothetical protein [Clostridia bacterium]
MLDRRDPGMTSVYYSEEDFSNVSVTVFTASPDYSSLADYAERYYFEQFKDNFNNLDLVKNQDGTLKLRTLKVDGCDAVAADYSAVFAGKTYKFRSFFISYGGSIYTVTYTATNDLFDAHTDAVEGMIEQMRFQ